MLRGVAADELSDDLAADGRPDVVDAVSVADFFGVVERCRAVAVGDNEDVVSRKDFERGFKCRPGGQVSRDARGNCYACILTQRY